MLAWIALRGDFNEFSKQDKELPACRKKSYKKSLWNSMDFVGSSNLHISYNSDFLTTSRFVTEHGRHAMSEDEADGITPGWVLSGWYPCCCWWVGSCRKCWRLDYPNGSEDIWSIFWEIVYVSVKSAKVQRMKIRDVISIPMGFCSGWPCWPEADPY